jgi:hypothetical protein
MALLAAAGLEVKTDSVADDLHVGSLWAWRCNP